MPPMGKLMRHPRGSKVYFKNPTTKESEQGIIVDEIWLPEPESFGEVAESYDQGWLETAFVAQLVEWSPGVENRGMRIIYYTRRGGRGPNAWVFAQFAPSMTVEDCRYIFQAMQDRGWFSGLPA